MRALAKLLVVREDKLGDCCLSLPLLEAIRILSPRTRVTWICQPPYETLFSEHPNVEEVWTYPRKPAAREQFRIWRRMRALQPDAVLLLRPNNNRWQRLSWLAGIPVRIGCEYSGKKGWLTTNMYTTSWKDIHEGRKPLEMLQTALGIKISDLEGPIRLTKKTESGLVQALDRRMLPESFYVLQLGMGGSSQAFPPEFFAQIAKRIFAEYGLEPVLTGSEEEQPLAEVFRIHYRSSFKNLIGTTSILELSELVSRAKFVLSVDTGTTHIAGCVRTPCVVLMPKLEVKPERWAPWSTSSIVVRPQSFCADCTSELCHPGKRTCVDSTDPEEVYQACCELLN